jgi:hypothetical protein
MSQVEVVEVVGAQMTVHHVEYDPGEDGQR